MKATPRKTMSGYYGRELVSPSYIGLEDTEEEGMNKNKDEYKND